VSVLYQCSSLTGVSSPTGADALAHGGADGVVTGHQVGEAGVPPAQRVQRLEAVEEPRSGLQRRHATRGAAPVPREGVAALDRLVVAPRARCNPVRMCSASGSTSRTALL